MIRRIFAGFIGALGILAGLYACGMTYELMNGIPRHLPALWKVLIVLLAVGSVAFGGLVLGLRFLEFALSGESARASGRLALVLLGLGCFFPGFALSFPLIMMLWVVHQANEDSAVLTALGVGISVGVTTAIAGCVLLLRRRSASSS